MTTFALCMGVIANLIGLAVLVGHRRRIEFWEKEYDRLGNCRLRIEMHGLPVVDARFHELWTAGQLNGASMFVYRLGEFPETDAENDGQEGKS